jgi:hypothetical protein
MARVYERLKIALPLTLILIFFLLYANTRSLTKTLIVLLAVPFSAVGAVWFLYLAGYNMSVGVWVGLIALLGVSEVLDCLPFLECRHPCLSEQADSNRIGSPHSFQTGMPALQGVPSSMSKRPRFYRAAEGNSSLAVLSLKQWLLTAAYPSLIGIYHAWSRLIRPTSSIPPRDQKL